MKVTGLNGKIYNLDTGGRVHEYDRDRSQYHKKAKKILTELFPSDIILEEVFLPGCKSKLYCDFFIPLRKLMIEVQGEQHSKYIQFFHRDIVKLLKSRRNDIEKKQFCELNKIKLVELDYKETELEWQAKILE